MGAPHVCILMATCNGATHLQEQLDSFLAQDHDNWSLWVSDDASRDDTRAILERFAAANPERRVHVQDGPGKGRSADNFLSLLAQADVPPGAFVALSDQDDVWMADHLSRALVRLEHGEQRQELRVYGGSTILVTDTMDVIGPSRQHPHPPSFGNALVQNILAGNTIVLNPPAADLAKRCAPAALARDGVPYHDWWLYLLMTGAGAQLIIDREPCLYYRQHPGNELGANRGFRSAWRRVSVILKREYAEWVDCNLAALARVQDVLTDDGRDCLNAFVRFRSQSGGRGHGFRQLRALGISRQSRSANMLLRIATVLGRF